MAILNGVHVKARVTELSENVEERFAFDFRQLQEASESDPRLRKLKTCKSEAPTTP